jgi:hypothetical protein
LINQPQNAFLSIPQSPPMKVTTLSTTVKSGIYKDRFAARFQILSFWKKKIEVGQVSE